jgi:cell division protein FtsB
MDPGNLMKGIINRIALVVFGVLAAATLLLGIFNDKGLLQVRAQTQKLKTIESDVTAIEAQNKALTEEIRALRTDPTTIEKLAREELKLVKPGEVVLVSPPQQ